MFADTEEWLKQIYLQNLIGVTFFIMLLLYAFFGPNNQPPKDQQGQLISDNRYIDEPNHLMYQKKAVIYMQLWWIFSVMMS